MTLRVLPALLAGAAVSGVQEPRAPDVRTVTYASRDGAELLLDLYLPAEPVRRPAPVIVFLHGGGWSGGTRTTGPDFRRYFAQDGFAMASIEYRLTPSITFPANVEDVRTAVRWLKANAAAHALDPDRICLWGTSAGGHLAAVAALAPRGMFEGSDNLNFTRAVRCVLDGYGPSASTRWTPRPRRSGPTCNLPSSPSTSAVPGAARLHRRVRQRGPAQVAAHEPAAEEERPCRMTIRRHRNRGCWARLCRVFPTACAPPVR